MICMVDLYINTVAIFFSLENYCFKAMYSQKISVATSDMLSRRTLVEIVNNLVVQQADVKARDQKYRGWLDLMKKSEYHFNRAFSMACPSNDVHPSGKHKEDKSIEPQSECQTMSNGKEASKKTDADVKDENPWSGRLRSKKDENPWSGRLRPKKGMKYSS